MLYSQIISAVYTETGRPDLVAQTAQQVMESTLALHQSDNYWPDLKEAVVAFPYNQRVQFIQLEALPRFRDLAYCFWDSGQATPEGNIQDQVSQTPSLPPLWPWWWIADGTPQLEVCEGPRDSIDPYFKTYKDNCAYVAGNAVKLHFSSGLQYARVGFYQYPSLVASDTGFVSWIADKYPYAIIMDAAGQLHRTKTGETEKGNNYFTPNAGPAWRQLQMLRQNSITGRAP